MEQHFSIILVNYKGSKDTIECLESLLKQNYTRFSIFVVDNSPDETGVEIIQQWCAGNSTTVETKFPNLVYPLENKPITHDYYQEIEWKRSAVKMDQKLTLIKQANNLGFAAANNVVLQKYKEFQHRDNVFVILNNDTVVPKDFLSNLNLGINNNQESEYFGVVILDYYKPEIIQSLAYSYNPYFATSQLIGGGVEYSKINKIDCSKVYNFPGPCMVMKNSYIEKCGLMPEEYFLYFEEQELIEKCKINSIKYTLLKESYVFHKLSQSIGARKKTKKSRISDYYSVRSRLLFTRKYYPTKIYTVYFSIIGVILNRLKRKQFSRIKMIIRLLINTELE